MNQHLISILVLFFSIIQKTVLPYSLVKTIRTYWAKIHSLWLMPLFKNMHYTVRFYKIGGLCGMQYISIDEKTIFQKGIYLTAYNVPSCITKPTLKIGKHCNFGAYNHITCANSIEIGDNVLTGKWVTISDNSHGATDKATMCIPPNERPIISKGKIKIGDNVWIGEKVTILADVTIGEGAVIAANSVITKNVAPYTVVAGVPAKVISKR